MEMITGFLLIPWVFISILAVIFLIQLILVENEYFGWTITSFLIVTLMMQLKYDIWSYFIENPLYVFLYIAGYLIMGVGWSILKWYNQVKKITRALNELKSRFSPSVEYPSMWEYLKSELKLYNTTEENINQKVKEWIKRETDTDYIIPWISYWPISLVSTLLNDPLRRLIIEIYTRLKGLYDKILNTVINSDIKDI